MGIHFLCFEANSLSKQCWKIGVFGYYVYVYLHSKWLQGAWRAGHQRGVRRRSQHSESSAGVRDGQPTRAGCHLWRQWSGCWSFGFRSQVYAGWWVGYAKLLTCIFEESDESIWWSLLIQPTSNGINLTTGLQQSCWKSNHFCLFCMMIAINFSRAYKFSDFGHISGILRYQEA